MILHNCTNSRNVASIWDLYDSLFTKFCSFGNKRFVVTFFSGVKKEIFAPQISLLLETEKNMQLHRISSDCDTCGLHDENDHSHTWGIDECLRSKEQEVIPPHSFQYKGIETAVFP